MSNKDEKGKVNTDPPVGLSPTVSKFCLLDVFCDQAHLVLILHRLQTFKEKADSKECLCVKKP